MATAGPNAPGTMADDSAVGTRTWATPDNAKVDDGTYTQWNNTSGGTWTSHYLKATNFGFAIPAGATINGVTAVIQRLITYTDGSTYVRDGTVKIVKGGTVSGDNKAATGTSWTTSPVDASYGGAADLWGLTLTRDDVNASTFGFVLSAILSDAPDYEPTVRVDFMSMTITYTEAGGGGGPVKQQTHYARMRG